MKAEPKPCSRCHTRPASTPRTAYCKPCRAEYQREWRRRRRGEPAEEFTLPDPLPRIRLRGTPTLAEMLRYRLI
ncbi:hypothetical protein [Amaricoccus sp.]|uniref:hypothetical protein n=1 Tax=Amaricoccus sp. TaxID=1872485 RepID=UPI002620F4D2|nr:hypothetical protein [Amaricoccus sp.]HRO13349.1 hypothetical protein [Amaricoccus sp.]